MPRNEKREIFLALLHHGTVMIHLDARRQGVNVPDRFRTDPHLRLNLDYAFRIPDFKVLENKTVATLSFSKKPHCCEIPFSAIWGMSVPRLDIVRLFPDSLPVEVLEEFGVPGKLRAVEETSEKNTPTPPRRGHLKLLN